MNKPNFKKIFWDRTLQNFSLALVVFAVLDIILICAIVSCVKSTERLELKKEAEEILNTPDLTGFSEPGK